jgi:hypothetical protein
MLKMPVDARKATEATGGVLDSTSKRVKEPDAAQAWADLALQ